MRWALDDEQEMLREAVTDWLDRDASSEKVRHQLDSGDASAIEHPLKADGWLGIGIPESQDGQGGALTELCIFAEALSAHAAPSSMWMATVLAAGALPNDDELLSHIASGQAGVALAVSSTAPLDATTGITAHDGHLSGVVRAVLGADRVQLFLVPVNTGSTVSLWAVDASATKVTPRTLLDRSRTCADIEFTNSAARLVHENAQEAIERAALRAAVLTAADTLGAVTHMREMALHYSEQRKQFGQAIGSFQAVKHAAAMMLVEEEAARSLVYYAAATVDASDAEAPLHAAASKAQVCAAGAHAADTALTLHGAIGYTWEHDLQLFYKRAKLNAQLFGPASVWNERIATELELI